MTNWKTTLLGWLVLIGTVISSGIAVLDTDPATVFDMTKIIAGLTGVGLIAASDAKKTPEA